MKALSIKCRVISIYRESIATLWAYILVHSRRLRYGNKTAARNGYRSPFNVLERQTSVRGKPCLRLKIYSIYSIFVWLNKPATLCMQRCARAYTSDLSEKLKNTRWKVLSLRLIIILNKKHLWCTIYFTKKKWCILYIIILYLYITKTCHII